MIVGQRTIQFRVDHAEHRAVGCDAEGERENYDGDKARRFSANFEWRTEDPDADSQTEQRSTFVPSFVAARASAPGLNFTAAERLEQERRSSFEILQEYKIKATVAAHFYGSGVVPVSTTIE